MHRIAWIGAALLAAACGGGAEPQPESPQAASAVEHYNSAQELMARRPPDAEGAIAAYGKALEAEPRFPQAYAGRARAKAGKADWAGAEADYAKAIETAGPDKAALYHFVRARFFHTRRGDLKRAEADYDAAMGWEEKRPDPYLADILMHRGLLYQDTRRPDRAVADYEKVLALNPDEATAAQVRRRIDETRGSSSGAGSR